MSDAFEQRTLLAAASSQVVLDRRVSNGLSEQLLNSALDIAELELATGLRENPNHGITDRAELALARPRRSANRAWRSYQRPVLAAQPLETVANCFV